MFNYSNALVASVKNNLSCPQKAKLFSRSSVLLEVEQIRCEVSGLKEDDAIA